MRLALPPPVAEQAPTRFPLLGALLPMVASVALAAILRAPLLLAFAALGPILAVGAFLDGRRVARRELRRAREARAAALDRLERDVAERRSELRRGLLAARPGVREMLGRPRPVPMADPFVVLGYGDVPSGIELDPLIVEDRGIAARAATVDRAPVLAGCDAGIGIVGPRVLREAAARAIAVQLAWWGADTARGAPDSRICTAESVAALGRHCAVVVRIDAADRAEVIRHPETAALVPVRPELVSLAELAAELARDRGGASDATEPPHAVELEVDLTESSRHPAGSSFLVGADGPLHVDLVSDGPHAVIGGTTGSGKSELLVSWALTLAARSSPDELAMLLFDFKGGSALDPLVALPHVSGLVTDLDGRMIDRAALSLRAELRRREAALRDAGARGIEQAPGLGRLVIIVDEFAALLDGRGELHDVFVDIAARGRSLGMHLLLCTQRPIGIIRDSLLANCGLRVSLRVVTADDSTALIGIARRRRAAAIVAGEMPGGHPRGAARAGPGGDARSGSAGGRDRAHSEALGGRTTSRLAASGGLAAAARHLHSARAGARAAAGRVTRRDRARALRQARDARPAGRLLALPSRAITRGHRRAGFGSIHCPPQHRAAARSSRHRRSVRDGLRSAVGCDPATRRGWSRRGRDPAGSRQVARTARSQTARARTARSRGGPSLDDAPTLIVDDFDAVLGQLDPDQLEAMIDRLIAALGSRRWRIALSVCAPLAPSVRAVVARVERRVLLRMPSRDEHLMLGGATADFDERAAPGAGSWDGLRIQIARTSPRPRSEPAAPPIHELASRQILVTDRPAMRASQLADAGALAITDVDGLPQGAGRAADGTDRPLVLVLDHRSWSSTPQLWRALEELPVLVDRCASVEYRQIARRRTPPPPLADLPDRAWLLHPEEEPTRVRLPLNRSTTTQPAASEAG